MTPPLSVLLIEDNLVLAQQVTEFLEGLGWQVDYASTGQQGVTLAVNAFDAISGLRPYDVVILDLNLPDLDGLMVCHQIKQTAAQVIPIIMLTARDAFEDKAAGFEQGADDYLTKPFDLRELGLRCQALAKRPRLHQSTHLVKGALSMDTRLLKVSWQNKDVPLTKTGFKILQVLLENYPEPVINLNICLSSNKHEKSYSDSRIDFLPLDHL